MVDTSENLNLTIATGVSDPSLIDALAAFFDSCDERTVTLSRQDLAAELGRTIPSDIAEPLFTGLVLHGVAEQSQNAARFADYRFSVRTDAAASVLHDQAIAARTLRQQAQPTQQDEVRLVATLPSHVDPPAGIDVISTGPELRQLMFDVDEQLRLATPYIDADQTVVEDLMSLPERGVDCRLLTRELTVGNEQTATAVNRIYSLLTPAARERFAVADLFSRDSSGRQAYATHAKVALADDSLCYIGSANLTTTSLESNFELGVLLTGPVVEDVVALFDRMFDAATVTDLPLGR